MRFYLTSPLILAISDSAVSALGVPKNHKALASTIITKGRPLLLATSGDDDVSEGMEDAFRQLDELKALGDDNPFAVPEIKTTQDEAFAKAMKDLDLKDIPESSVESEAGLYQGMASELAGKTEEDLMARIKVELGGGKDLQIPKFDPTMRETDKMMEKALDEALEEAGKELNVDKKSLLDNKEIMKEIEKIFDKANAELLSSLEDIRAEQMAMAKDSAKKNSEQSAKKIEEDQQRLAIAEANMRKMLDKVNQETKNVALAIDDLKKVQVETEGGLDSQLVDLKSGGFAKQATLVGTLLFGLRSTAEAVAFLGGDASHLFPAMVQAVIALVCLAAFVFL